MKIIIISGPSGSGKTYLSNKLSKLLDNSIVIKTDSYYRDNILIRFLSIFLYDIYDRFLSIKKYEIMKTLISINNKERLIEKEIKSGQTITALIKSSDENFAHGVAV